MRSFAWRQDGRRSDHLDQRVHVNGDSKALAVTKRIRIATTMDAVPYIHRPDVFDTVCPGVEDDDESSEDEKATYSYWLRSASDPETEAHGNATVASARSRSPERYRSRCPRLAVDHVPIRSR